MGPNHARQVGATRALVCNQPILILKRWDPGHLPQRVLAPRARKATLSTRSVRHLPNPCAQRAVTRHAPREFNFSHFTAAYFRLDFLPLKRTSHPFRSGITCRATGRSGDRSSHGRRLRDGPCSRSARGRGGLSDPRRNRQKDHSLDRSQHGHTHTRSPQGPSDRRDDGGQLHVFVAGWAHESIGCVSKHLSYRGAPVRGRTIPRSQPPLMSPPSYRLEAIVNSILLYTRCEKATSIRMATIPGEVGHNSPEDRTALTRAAS